MLILLTIILFLFLLSINYESFIVNKKNNLFNLLNLNCNNDDNCPDSYICGTNNICVKEINI